MSRLIIFFVIAIFFIASCNKNCLETNHRLSISITNFTKFDCDVLLFPKQVYIEGASLYRLSENGSGFSEKDFTILQIDTVQLMMNKRTIYGTSDTSMQANILLAQVFDSIHIPVRNNENTIIRFLPDTVFNYIQNPYSNDSIWHYDILGYNAPDSDCANPQLIKSYSFRIKSDLME